MILGTAAYMAPEQARGKAVDRRADIWSFGVVFYEMLAGKRLYGGETVSDTLAAVLKMEPDWNALPAEVPPAIRRLLRRCLTKDVGNGCKPSATPELKSKSACRLRQEDRRGSRRAEACATGRWREQLAWALAGAFLIAAIVSTVSYLREARAPAHCHHR